MTVITDRLMDYQETGDNVYLDLEETWYTEAFLKNIAAGIFKGFNGEVRPNDYITRQEAVVVLSRAMNIEKDSRETKFADDDQIANRAKGYVKTFSDLGYINGMPDGTFAPTTIITRAEIVKVEVPVMLILVKIENNTRGWFEENKEIYCSENRL